MLKYHIQTIEVGAAGAGSIAFNNIPQDYDDLMILVTAKTNDISNHLSVRFNGLATGFTGRSLAGNGSSSASYSRTTNDYFVFSVGTDKTANVFSNAQIFISNYTKSNFKSISIDNVQENNSTASNMGLEAFLWSNSAAVSEISLFSQSGGSVAQYSSASLYGIKRGSSGEVEVASGGTITTSGGYTYHTFTSSGTFVANRDLQVEALVLAGGGGGGEGGGGAGGVTSGSFQTSADSYLVAIGSGGTGTPNGATVGSSGQNSSFMSMLAIGGGRGGVEATAPNNDGASGGSGGGGRRDNGGQPGYGTDGQGNRAGFSAPGPFGGSGGGGGAGAVGGNGLGGSSGAEVGGFGGIGTNLYSDWLSAIAASMSGVSGWSTATSGGYIAGGGGAGREGSGPTPTGVGGAGGGGSGQNNTSIAATSGIANTGGGGGGRATRGSTGLGGNGGSGIVIIRYLTPA